MSLDGAAIFQDLLRAATLGLFALAAFHVKGIGDTVKDLHSRVNNHGERIARIEGVVEQGD